MTAKRQWTLLTALACLIVLVAGYMLLVRPQHSKAASVKTQTAGVQTQITSLRAQLAQLQEQSRNLAGQQAQLARIAQQLPSDPQEPTLLRTIQQSATTTGVDLTSLAPGNPVAFTPPATTGTAATTTPVAGLAQIPVVLTVSGGYFQMERFLDSLEGLQRSMLVNSFTLAYKAPSTTTSSAPVVGAGEITATINAQVFMSTAAVGSTTGSATTTGAPSATATTAS